MSRSTGSRPAHRLARWACPPDSRGWIEAMFAELEQVEGRGRRVKWVAGAAAVVAAAIRVRAAEVLSPRLRVGLLGLAMCAVLFGFAALAGYEGLGLDDDVYLAGAASAAAGWLGAGAFVLAKVFAESGVIATSHTP